MLVRQPQGTRDFLLYTSVLDRMTGPLCDAVTGLESGQDVLERLEQVNLFVVPLDNRRQWYRYHHLFADMLRTALGYGRINLFSESYGTRLAMIYAWRHPESVYRSAMVGINPPGHMFYYDPAVTDEQLACYAGLCAQSAECSALTGDLAATIRTVSRNMPDR